MIRLDRIIAGSDIREASNLRNSEARRQVVIGCRASPSAGVTCVGQQLGQVAADDR